MNKKAWATIAIGLALLLVTPFISVSRSVLILQQTPIFSVPKFSSLQNTVPKPTEAVSNAEAGDRLKIGASVIMDSYLGYIVQTGSGTRGLIIFENGAFREVRSPIPTLTMCMGAILILVGFLWAGRPVAAGILVAISVIAFSKNSVQDILSKRSSAQTTKSTVLFGDLYRSCPLRIIPAHTDVNLIRRVYAKDAEYDRVQIEGQKGYLDASAVSIR